MRFLVGVVVLASACTRTMSFSNGQNACTVHNGMTSAQVLQSCGVPSGLRMQPKVSTWFGDACSAPVYVYPGAMVAFGCGGGVATVAAAPARVGIEVDKQFLRDEIRGRRHAEAALVQLVLLDSDDSETYALIVEVEAQGTPISAAAGRRARELLANRKPK